LHPFDVLLQTRPTPAPAPPLPDAPACPPEPGDPPQPKTSMVPTSQSPVETANREQHCVMPPLYTGTMSAGNASGAYVIAAELEKELLQRPRRSSHTESDSRSEPPQVDHAVFPLRSPRAPGHAVPVQ
jgi:hypothetical protein